jgi:hypothetical protein
MYYLKTPVDSVKNIGWLDSNRKYSVGKVAPDFLPKLGSIIIGTAKCNAQVNRMRSTSPCRLSDCDIQEIECHGSKECLGASEVWVPLGDNGMFYAAPSMVYHYIEEHDYLPPEGFISAVMGFDLEQEFNAQDIYLDLIQGHF